MLFVFEHLQTLNVLIYLTLMIIIFSDTFKMMQYIYICNVEC